MSTKISRNFSLPLGETHALSAAVRAKACFHRRLRSPAPAGQKPITSSMSTSRSMITK